MADPGLLWLAGYVDRSCFLGISKYRRKRGAVAKDVFRAMLKVQCKDREVLEPLVELYGGAISPVHGEAFGWTVAGRQYLEPLLKLLLPYLRVRRESAKNILAFYAEFQKIPQGSDDPDWEDLRQEIRLQRNNRATENQLLKVRRNK